MAYASSTAATVTTAAASSAPRVKDEKDDAPAERAAASLLTALPRFPMLHRRAPSLPRGDFAAGGRT